MGKNSRKAFGDDGKLKKEYSLDIGGKTYGLLSVKGNYTSWKTKNGRSRRNQILKTDKTKNNYISFYNSTQSNNPNNKVDKIKPLEKKKNVNKNDFEEAEKPDLSKGMVKAAKKNLVKEVEDMNDEMEGEPPKEPDDDPNQEKRKKPTGANISMNISRKSRKDFKKGENVPTGGGNQEGALSGFTGNIEDKANRGESGQMGVGAYGAPDGKKEKGIHQGLINRIKGIDYSAVRDEIARQTKVNPAQANKGIQDLIEASKFLREVKQRYRTGRMVVKEFIELKAIVRCFELMEESKNQKKNKDLKIGAVLDLEKMFGLGKMNMEKFKQLLVQQGVFENSNPVGTVGAPVQQPQKQRDMPIKKPNEEKARVSKGALDQVASAVGEEGENPQEQDNENTKKTVGKLSKMSVQKAPFLQDTNNFDFQNTKKEDTMKKSTHFRYRKSKKGTRGKAKRRTIF